MNASAIQQDLRHEFTPCSLSTDQIESLANPTFKQSLGEWTDEERAYVALAIQEIAREVLMHRLTAKAVFQTARANIKEARQ